MRVNTNPDGTLSATLIQAGDEPGEVDRFTVASGDELLTLIPPYAEDRAFVTLCQAVLVCGSRNRGP